MSSTPGAGPSSMAASILPGMQTLSLQADALDLPAPHTLEADEENPQVMPTAVDAKPPLVTAYSAPPVLQTEPEGIREGFTFGTCPSTTFMGTPTAEKGPFEYPDLTQSAGSSRRPSLAQLSLRRGSSFSSTVSTVTSFSTATRRPSLAPLPLPSDFPDFQASAQARRRGSIFHFQTKPVTAPIPPSLLARRGSLPAAEAIFGLPSTERRRQSRFSVSGAHVVPQSPPTLSSTQHDPPSSPPHRRASLRIRLPPSVAARRGSLPTSPSHPIFPAQTLEPHSDRADHDRTRQSTSTNSSRGSLLSHSSLSTDDVIKDDDESTDQDTAGEVDTPGSSSETEAMGLFTDPWREAAVGPAIVGKADERLIVVEAVQPGS